MFVSMLAGFVLLWSLCSLFIYNGCHLCNKCSQYSARVRVQALTIYCFCLLSVVSFVALMPVLYYQNFDFDGAAQQAANGSAANETAVTTTTTVDPYAH